MAVVRKIRVSGAEYKMVSPPKYDAHMQLYCCVVERANGVEANAYSNSPNGPFVFKTAVQEQPEQKADSNKQAVTVVRHGSTAMNAENGGSTEDRIRGWANVPLSPKGREEVRELGAKLADSGIERIYHSDLDRAHDTAQAISNTTGAPMIAVPGLRPWHVGQFTGQPSTEVIAEIKDYAKNAPDTALPDGESFNQFRARVFSALQAIMQQSEGRKVALVTHHRVERLIKSWKAAGSSPDGSVDLSVMFSRGDKPATAENVILDLDALNNVRII